MVGTHFPDDRDVLESALQRMREAFEALRDAFKEQARGLIDGGADLLLVDGNPLEDISAVERISIVFFKGEQLDRSDLFSQE